MWFSVRTDTILLNILSLLFLVVFFSVSFRVVETPKHLSIIRMIFKFLIVNYKSRCVPTKVAVLFAVSSVVRPTIEETETEMEERELAI